MMKFAIKRVAALPWPGIGQYRYTHTCAANRDAAEYAVEREIGNGFSAKVIEVSEEEFDAIYRGERNGYQDGKEV